MNKKKYEFEELKKVLRAILISTPLKLGVKDLLRDYRKLEGKDVAFKKFGYATFVDLLLSISDVCVLEYESDQPTYVVPIITEELSCIRDLVSKQKPPENKPKQKRTSGINIPKIIPANLQYAVINFVEKHPKGIEVELLKQEICSKFPLHYIGIDSIEEILEEMSHLIRFFDGKVFPAVNRITGKSCDGPQPSEGTTLYDSSQMLPVQIVENIKNLIKENPSGLLLSELLGKYKETYGCPLPYKKYGYAAIPSIISAYPNMCHINRVSSCDFMLKEKKPDELANTSVNSGEASENYLAVQSLKDNLIWLLSNYPAGLLMGHLHETYKIHFPRGFCEIELGFPDLKSMLVKFERQSVLEIRDEREGLKLYPSSSCHPVLESESDDEEVEPEEEELDETFSSSNKSTLKSGFERINHHPANTVGPGVKISQQDTTGLDLEALEVTIAHVESPSKFWFILNYEYNCRAFDTLVELMQGFYEKNSDKFVMNRYAINEDRYCVCQLRGIWHRALITKIVTDTEVEIYFIDIGMTVRAKNSSLRYLLKMFSSVSAQAFEAKLSNLVPVNSIIWEQEVCDYFSEIASGISFIGVIKDTQNDVTRCDMLYFEDDEWHSLCDKLVAEEFADYVKPAPPTVYKNNLSIEQQLSKFTFI